MSQRVVFYYNKTTYLTVVVAGAGAAAMVSVTATAAVVGSAVPAVLAGVLAGVPLLVGDPFYMWKVGFTIYLNK